MINSIFPFPIQASVQAVTQNVVVSPLAAASTWIDDLIALWLVFDY